MKTGRVELRVDAELRTQLEDLAGHMQCGISEVLRRLVADEHGRRFGSPAAGPAEAVLIEAGIPPEQFGIAV